MVCFAQPKRFFCLIIGVFFCAFSNISVFGRQSPSIPQRQAQRAALVEKFALESRSKKIEAENWAKTYGLPVRHFDGKNTFELMEIRDGRPLYKMTHNLNAAVSTAANLVRDNSPYYANGYGFNIGIWDSGLVLSTHQEFIGRVFLMDSTASHYHSTHVGGTIGAAGVVASAKGMAPSVNLYSYDWSDALTEMADAAASYPQEPDKIYISNHSYGTSSGWVWTNWSGTYAYHWNQNADWAGASSYEPYFGQYDSDARSFDLIAYDNPYYLIFKSAGNDRQDNPEVGETVYYRKNNRWQALSYSTGVAPPGDGVVKSGYDTIACESNAKNIITVGAVNDAVTSGVRDISKAAMTVFSGWGPADDGRIKPDIVANGIEVYSTDNDNNSDYITMSGTSMSSPDAAGSAMLLIDCYNQLHPGQAMRSSTLKGLIIHTADDLGNPGPDYSFGWGLMNTKKAVDALTEDIIVEGLLDASNPDDVYEYYFESARELRATLCWTDPPGAATSLHDSRTRKLINDLDLRIIAPDGTTTYYPFMLDYANPSANAAAGDNISDNVEQVLLTSASQTGLYQIRVSYKGTLTNSQQHYSLIISPPSQPIVPQPPVAADVNVIANPVVAVNIVLEGSDDGLPDPPAALEYIILSLPQYGDLNDPCGAIISSVPYTLINNGNILTYTSLSCFTGTESFDYIVNDGGIAPDGGNSNTAVVSIQIRTDPIVIYQEDFEQGLPAGWSIIDGFADEKTWMSDNPSSRTSPAGSWTGTFMLVDSDWAGYVDMNELLITQSFDFSDYENVMLSFKHYFNYYSDEIGDVDISIDGGPWQNVARYQGNDFDGLVELDISSFADGEPNVQICWHYYNANYDYYWGVDDVQITARPVYRIYAGDFEPDCDVDFYDFGSFALYWLAEPNDTEWDSRYDISEPNDGIIDFRDLEVFSNSWLMGLP